MSTCCVLILRRLHHTHIIFVYATNSKLYRACHSTARTPFPVGPMPSPIVSSPHPYVPISEPLGQCMLLPGVALTAASAMMISLGWNVNGMQHAAVVGK